MLKDISIMSDYSWTTFKSTWMNRWTKSDEIKTKSLELIANKCLFGTLKSALDLLSASFVLTYWGKRTAPGCKTAPWSVQMLKDTSLLQSQRDNVKSTVVLYWGNKNCAIVQMITDLTRTNCYWGYRFLYCAMVSTIWQGPNCRNVSRA